MADKDIMRERPETQVAAKILDQPVRVVVTNVSIPFGSMIGLLTTMAVAAIPAALLAALVIYGVVLSFSMLMEALP